MAAEAAATQAAQTRRRRAGQQDGPYSVGHDEERRDVPAPVRPAGAASVLGGCEFLASLNSLYYIG